MKKIILLFVFISQIIHSNGFQSLRMDVDARSAALGQAATALVAGGSSNFANPATIPVLAGHELIFSTQNWIQGIKSRYLGLASGNMKNGFGLQVLYTDISEIEHRLTNTSEPLSTFSAYEFIAGLAYAHRLSKHLFSGLQVKTMYEKIYLDDALGFGLDLSLYWQSQQDGLAFGISIQNIGRSSKMRVERIALPTLIRYGISMPIHTSLGTFRCMVDGIQERDATFHLGSGLEYQWQKNLFLRVGYQTGYDEVRDLSAGVGIAWKSYALDYCYIPLQSGWGTASQLTFRIR